MNTSSLLLHHPLNLTTSSSTLIASPSTSYSYNFPLNYSISYSLRTAITGDARSFTKRTCVCECAPRDGNLESWKDGDGVIENSLFGTEDDRPFQIPTQAQSLVEGSQSVMISEFKPPTDVDYLQELLAIQQQGPRNIGFFGTRNMGFMHQELIEILSYAMVITKNHIFTSGASGTNAAVIRGALRAEKPEFLTVILPQSLKKQPPESQELLSKVKNVVEKPYNDHLPLIEASRLCNMDIISQVQQVICFAFHDSRLLMETCQEAKNMRKIVTLFYLD
ncbi:unnamed protein product [Rhodiola kirilowii]